MGDTPYLSIVVPAYNEERRLPSYLETIIDYLKRQDHSAEILIVDDGSEDGTVSAASRYVSDFPDLRIVRNQHMGKAVAVTTGMLQAQGRYVLFCDADGATPIVEFDKLRPFLEDGYDVVIGSREGSDAHRFDEPWFRHVMGRVFNLIARALAVRGIQDTQCGFKAFSADAASAVFRRLRLYESGGGPVRGAMVTGFDVEVLFVAQKLGYSIKEVPVHWYYSDESKVNPLRDSFRNLRDVLRVRVNDWRGKYRQASAAKGNMRGFHAEDTTSEPADHP
jgi:dolichyl-phosphate beta-glucosyltransferase